MTTNFRTAYYGQNVWKKKPPSCYVAKHGAGIVMSSFYSDCSDK